jgi:hypothetical protein
MGHKMDSFLTQYLSARLPLADVPELIGALAALARDGLSFERPGGQSIRLDRPPYPAKAEISRRITSRLLRLGFAESSPPRGPSKVQCLAGTRDGDINEPAWLVVTDEGLAFLKHIQVATDADVGTGDCGRPRWRAGRRELWFGRELVRRFRKAAPNQERLLTAFEESNWPAGLDDPLPSTHGIVASHRLRETVKRINRGLRCDLIHFGTDGSGKRACWRRL